MRGAFSCVTMAMIARRGFGLGRVDPGDAALAYRAVDERGVGQVRDLEFGRERCLAPDLQLPIDAADWFSDMAVFVHERVRLSVRHELATVCMIFCGTLIAHLLFPLVRSKR